MIGTVRLAAAAACLVVLVACDSAEERAEQHFQAGVALLEAGDVDRALVEFRNVFRLNGLHKEARRRFAQAEIERGNVEAGYSQYLRLVEQYPEDVDARRELTRVAVDMAQWDEVERHAPLLVAAAPDDPVAKLADLGLRYRAVVEADDPAARRSVIEEVRGYLEVDPDETLLYELLADHYVREEEREQALDALTRAIELSPDQMNLHMMRLALLQEMGDLDGVEARLRELVTQFPEDVSAQATLLRWYMSQGNLAAAEVYLRERAEASPESAGRVDLVQFLARFRSLDAAIAELDSILASDVEEKDSFRALRASLRFERGEREAGIEELQEIIDTATEDSDQLRGMKVTLARMLSATGNQVGARALVEDVLAGDAGNVEALKMQAEWLIDSDETDQAILTLRSALEQSPRDPSIMTLMARAHERSGNRDLVGEMLSLAVEASNSAPDETVRYARFLLADGKLDVAESSLVDSLRLNPNNLVLLQTLGSIYLQQADWARAEQVADTLASVEDPEFATAANELRTQILAGQGRADEVVGFLQQLLSEGEAGSGAELAIVRTYVESGELAKAQSYVDARLGERPGDDDLRFLKASLMELEGKSPEAEEAYVALTESRPKAALPWRALYLLQARDGRPEEASATLARALEANPANLELLWMRASELERSGDREGALSVYEEMYALNSDAPVIANNLASLLTTVRDDEEALERAYNVARRLRDVEVPEFQDTFGWIAFLRGEHEVAVEHLVPAAEALTEDPLVQYHAGAALAEVGRTEEARVALERAVELFGADSTVPQLAAARETLAELGAPPVEN